MTYTLQNVDSNGRIFIRTAAVKPVGAALRGFAIGPFQDTTLVPVLNAGIWVWTDRTDGCKAVLDETA